MVHTLSSLRPLKYTSCLVPGYQVCQMTPIQSQIYLRQLKNAQCSFSDGSFSTCPSLEMFSLGHLKNKIDCKDIRVTQASSYILWPSEKGEKAGRTVTWRRSVGRMSRRVRSARSEPPIRDSGRQSNSRVLSISSRGPEGLFLFQNICNYLKEILPMCGNSRIKGCKPGNWGPSFQAY